MARPDRRARPERYHLTPSLAEALAGLPSPTEAAGTYQEFGHVYRPLRGLDIERASLLREGESMRHLPERLWHATYRKRAFRRVQDGTPTERRGGAPAGLRRLRGDEPSKAITSSAANEFIHPVENRALTLRECARLQTFPDTFVFHGTRSERATLIGNAVPPRLAHAVAAQLRTDLEAQPDTTEAGKLLSFVPTLSEGTSPALADVIALVAQRFFEASSPAEQFALWL